MRDFEKDKFQSFQNINIYFLANLHAKCYLNENTALITSMNLYGYSEENNREMGIEINKSENYGLYEDILKESKSIKNQQKSIIYGLQEITIQIGEMTDIIVIKIMGTVFAAERK